MVLIEAFFFSPSISSSPIRHIAKVDEYFRNRQWVWKEKLVSPFTSFICVVSWPHYSHENLSGLREVKIFGNRPSKQHFASGSRLFKFILLCQTARSYHKCKVHVSLVLVKVKEYKGLHSLISLYLGLSICQSLCVKRNTDIGALWCVIYERILTFQQIED